MYNNKCTYKVAPRFELGDNGFAIHGLTTWLCHHIARSYLTLKAETLETLENNLSLGSGYKLAQLHIKPWV